MSDNELLLAISSMMDSMMDKKLEPLQKNVSKLQEEMKDMKVQMRDMEVELKNEMSDMKEELRSEISGVKDELRSEISGVKKELGNEISDLKAQMRGMDTRLKKIEITQENEILPRLQNIEACYTSTYERYAEGADQIQNTMQDMTLIKKVVTEHSAKLKRIQ